MDYREGFWVILYLLKEDFNILNNRGKVLFSVLDNIELNNSTSLIALNSRITYATVQKITKELHKEGIVDMEYKSNKVIVTFNPLFIESAIKWRETFIEKLKNED